MYILIIFFVVAGFVQLFCLLSFDECSVIDIVLYYKRFLSLYCRIVDNMPVTWCYDVEDNQKFCNPGFPIGCYVTNSGVAKDACVVNVSLLLLEVPSHMNNYLFISLVDLTRAGWLNV